MDENTTRRQIDEHADAVVRGDMDTVVGDFSDELRPQAPELAKALPQPVTSAEVLSVEVGEDECVARISYAGPDKQVTIRTRWRDFDGRPMIVAGEPVD
jgi:hypothetical protein